MKKYIYEIYDILQGQSQGLDAFQFKLKVKSVEICGWGDWLITRNFEKTSMYCVGQTLVVVNIMVLSCKV